MMKIDLNFYNLNFHNVKQRRVIAIRLLLSRRFREDV